MDDLVAFLRARLDEEYAEAEGAGGDEWTVQEHESDTVAIYDSRREPVVYDEGVPTRAQMAHIARHDPARVLREVEAKRKLLDLYERTRAENPGRRAFDWEHASWRDRIAGPAHAVRLLASMYADHPDYRPEWAPDA